MQETFRNVNFANDVDRLGLLLKKLGKSIGQIQVIDIRCLSLA